MSASSLRGSQCVVESLNHIIRHQNAAAALFEHFFEHNQPNDTDEDTQSALASVFTTLQYITSSNDSSKSALDDFG
jgi:ethanolamine ammonia-lyase large subunit